MIYSLNPIRKLFLGLSLSEAEFEARGFATGSEAQERLELVAKTVVNGYNVAVEHGLSTSLDANNNFVMRELNGFFNEGVGMGLYALDLFSLFKKNRFWEFVAGKGNNHEYMAYIGAGLATGVFDLSFKKFLDKASPTSGCLILDGIGFYNAYFHPGKTIQKFFVPRNIHDDAFFLERYDNGIGRALWFYTGGQPDKIKKVISTFPEIRRSAIWSGVGLAATYAGGVSHDKIRSLKELSGKDSIMVAQGSILASHTRHRAGNPHKDDTTSIILVGKTSLECHNEAKAVIAFLDNRRFIDGKHSFQVFLEMLRCWAKDSVEAPLEMSSIH